ncbi:MAG: 30S ribosomal protein S3 [Candidatus Nanoarchaeia archaeon]|jgi:small subunit ribosomal protein S3
MIERKFIKEKLSDYKIQKFLLKNFERSSYSHAVIQKTPLGDKIIIFSSRPGMIVGRGGENLKKITEKLKELGIQNPQVDVQEVDNAMLDPSLIAERIVEMFLKMGTGRFKFIGHNICEKVLLAGAKGVQVTLAGRIPAARAKMWKFIMGFLPKCGSVAYEDVDESFRIANLKTGVIGVRVKILPPNVRMPDEIILLNPVIEEHKDIKVDVKKEESIIKVMEKEEDLEKKTAEVKDKKAELKEKIAELAKKIESKKIDVVEELKPIKEEPIKKEKEAEKK